MARKQTMIAGGDEYTEQAVNAFMESGQHDGFVVPDAPEPVTDQQAEMVDKYHVFQKSSHIYKDFASYYTM